MVTGWRATTIFKNTDFPRGAVDDLKSLEFRSSDRHAIHTLGKHVALTNNNAIKRWGASTGFRVKWNLPLFFAEKSTKIGHRAAKQGASERAEFAAYVKINDHCKKVVSARINASRPFAGQPRRATNRVKRRAARACF